MLGGGARDAKEYAIVIVIALKSTAIDDSN